MTNCTEKISHIAGNTHNCIWCNKEYISNRKIPGACSRECRIRYGNQKLSDRRREMNNEKYKDVQDIPTCIICGWKSRTLQSHIQSVHHMSVAEYKEKYSASTCDIFHSSYTQDKSDRISGVNNPGFQHGGKMSSFSRNNEKYIGLSDDQKQQQIDAQIKKANHTKKQNDSYNTTVEFYITKGCTPEEATTQLKSRQRTFALDVCINKYGQEEGIKRWQERQQKWLNTLKLLSDEEKLRIEELKRAAFNLSYSRISTNMFDSLNIPGALYGSHEVTLTTLTGQKLKPDFVFGTKIIEFYGDFWHANPMIYGPDDMLKCPIGKGRYSMKMVMSIWLKDELRINRLVELGYDVLIIWEQDYRKNPTECIKKCLDFLAK